MNKKDSRIRGFKWSREISKKPLISLMGKIKFKDSRVRVFKGSSETCDNSNPQILYSL